MVNNNSWNVVTETKYMIIVTNKKQGQETPLRVLQSLSRSR